MFTREGRILAYIFIPLGTVVFLFIASPFILLLFSAISGDFAIDDFEQQLEDSIPEDVELIAIDSTFGTLQDTGSGDEFLAVALIKSELSIEALSSYFTEYDFEHAKPDQRLQVRDPDDYHHYQLRLQVSKVDDLPIETEFTGSSRDIVFFDDETIEDFTNIYFIAIYDPAYVF